MRLGVLFFCFACGAVSPPPSFVPFARMRAGEPVAEESATAGPVDSDGDGVPDKCDHCPRQPGVNRADHPYGRGCPYIDAFVDSGAFLREPIRFARGDARLSVSLDAIAQEMRRLAAPDAHTSERYFVIGHASADEPSAEELALRRAQAVADALVAAGVDRTQLEVHAAGTAHAVSGVGRAARRRSRRVELDLSHYNARNHAWNDERREVEAVIPPDLPCD